MVRNYIRKTESGKFSQATMKEAVRKVIECKQSVRGTSRQFGLNHVTLTRYVKAARTGTPMKAGLKPARKVFSEEQEEELVVHITAAAKIFFKVSPINVKNLAYQLAERVKCGYVAKSWRRTRRAGQDWFGQFHKTRKDLPIRYIQARKVPLEKSLGEFYDKLSEILNSHAFENSDIWNVDETDIASAIKSEETKIPRSEKLDLVSEEKDLPLTMCIAVNSSGKYIPPMLIFPGTDHTEDLYKSGPAGCIGVSHPIGWMTDYHFSRFIDHFVEHTEPSKEKPILLLLDNDSSHISLDILSKCEKHNLVLLSFPPKCSKHLQPLEQGLIQTLHENIQDAQENWLMDNTIQNANLKVCSELLAHTLPLSFTPDSISEGFNKTGIVPYNRHLISELPQTSILEDEDYEFDMNSNEEDDDDED